MPVKRFVHVRDLPSRVVHDDHGGSGPIHFRRLMRADDFDAPVDFVDFTRIPPGSSIGFHGHQGNEEVYMIAAGEPLMRVDDEERRLSPGDVTTVRSGGHHGLRNDTDEEVVIFVVQVRLPES